MTSDFKKSGLTLWTSDNQKTCRIKHLDTHVEVDSKRKDPVTNSNGVTIDYASLVFKQPLGYNYMTSDGLGHLDNDIFATVRALGSNIASNNSTLTTSINQLQTDLTHEVNRAQSAESVNATAISAEVTRASAAETTLDAKIDQEIIDRVALGVQVNAKIDSQIAQEITDRESNDATLQAAINTEVTDRTNAVASLQSQITNILSNTDPAALDSLSEIVNALNTQGNNLTQLITVLGSRVTDLETEFANHLGD